MGTLCDVVLQTARGVLSNTYAFAYFFFGNEMYKEDFTAEENCRNQNLFEGQQVMLETEVRPVHCATLGLIVNGDLLIQSNAQGFVLDLMTGGLG